jgi:cbb3-type cytochrome oxidase maturation protein
MEILYLLIPISLILVFLIGVAFWWSLRNGQFDDMEGPGYRVLMDDDTPQKESTKGGVSARKPH